MSYRIMARHINIAPSIHDTPSGLGLELGLVLELTLELTGVGYSVIIQQYRLDSWRTYTHTLSLLGLGLWLGLKLYGS